MTQAFNLSQLANNLNSSGQLDATDGLTNAVPVANGGTGASTASAAQVNLDVPATDGTGATGEWPIDISGNAATASAATAFSTTNWTIEQSGLNLVFKYNGVAVGSISSVGVINAASNLTTTSGNITASGSISANSMASTTTITSGGNITAGGTVTANGT
jgi:hypothetical protein